MIVLLRWLAWGWGWKQLDTLSNFLNVSKPHFSATRLVREIIQVTSANPSDGETPKKGSCLIRGAQSHLCPACPMLANHQFKYVTRTFSHKLEGRLGNGVEN